ncbi:MAG: 2-oxo acid dehydrogenase subunit E2 [Actinomycetota bacterium]|nr:2-oxo acid dehydrogenase subunit E2 [Actinomycetota bacterium]
MADFALPDLGEGVAEAEIDRWLVEEGQQIDEDDPLVEVITDKVTAEIPSPYAGTVSRIHVHAGEVVPVGTILVTIGDSSAAPLDDTVSPDDTASPAAGIPTEAGARAMPPIRRLARALGVDVETISGSGPGDRILREDVEAAARSSAPESEEAQPEGHSRGVPLSGVRRSIAERMLHAHLTIPPVTHVEECDVTELEATRRLANERAPDEVRLTFLPFIVKAAIQGLKDHPPLNASLDDDVRAIHYHDRYDIGIAVDTPSGLMVPVIKDADQKRLRAIAYEIERLSVGAREGSLTRDDLSAGTFTVTSPGAFGGVMATPIVLPPQSAILGVHRATDRAVVRDGQIVIRKMLNLSVTFDHRILDGMTAARFILEVVQLLEHPAVLALEA